MLGFASTGPARHGGDPHAVGELYAFYLDPDSWGDGIGVPLHAAAVAGLRDDGFDTAVLRVLAANGRALRFYRREGWTGTGREGIWHGPEGVELPECELDRSLDAL